MKPHRSYHCSTCERDIVYMDRHCFWFNNCIGINNYRYFLAFIFYICLIMPLLLFPFVISLFDMEVKKNILSLSSKLLVAQLLGAVTLLDMLFLMIIVPYSVWNWRLAINGITQVEHAKNLFRFRDKQGSCTEILCSYFANHKKHIKLNQSLKKQSNLIKNVGFKENKPVLRKTNSRRSRLN